MGAVAWYCGNKMLKKEKLSISTCHLVKVEQMCKVSEDVLSLTEDIASSGRCVTGEISCVISCSEYATCKLCNSKVLEEGVVCTFSKCSRTMPLVSLQGCY